MALVNCDFIIWENDTENYYSSDIEGNLFINKKKNTKKFIS
jgi:hypothetical protein